MFISYSIVACPLGCLLVAATEQGICAVSLGDTDAELEADLRSRYPNAQLQRDRLNLSDGIDPLLAFLEGHPSPFRLPLDIQQSTVFQNQVWQALQAIPPGSTRSYQEIAEALHRPTAARAVARACATNPIALIIPCHRVIRGDGSHSGYRWGLERKRFLLALEATANLPLLLATPVGS